MHIRAASIALAAVLALPFAATGQPTITPEAPDRQTAPPPSKVVPEDDPLDLIERGTGMIFNDLMRRVQPHLEGLARGVDETVSRFGPALQDLGALIDDIGNYEAPERLPNGDVILRRKADAPPPPPIGNALRDLTGPTNGHAPDDPPRDPPATLPEDDAPAAPIEL